MRMIAVYHKAGALSGISHLDVQRTLQRAFRRAGIPLAYSNGFNPHPQLSFASALSTGATSDAEWFDVQLMQDMEPEAFMECVNAVMPQGLWLSHGFAAPEGFGSLSAKTTGAAYEVDVHFDQAVTGQALQEAIESLLAGEIIVNKRTKSGIKPVDIRPQIQMVSVTGIEGNNANLLVHGKLQADGGLRVELLLGALYDRLATHGTARIHRKAMYFAGDGPLPRLPEDWKEKE